MSIYDSVGAAEMNQTAMEMADRQMQDILGDGQFMEDVHPLDLDLANIRDRDSQNYRPLSPQHRMQTSDDSSDGQTAQNESFLSAMGVRPLSTSFNMQLAPNAGSTLTDFTKRRKWSQRVIEELKDFLHILTSDGKLVYVSPSSKTLTGHDPQHLVGKFISDFIHPDDSAIFVREFNESIASGNALRFFYRFRKFDNTYIIFESHGHPHIASEATAASSSSGANSCSGFFMMARPYPTKNASLLDSFLEHKIENERLRKRIADLKREEQEDLEDQQRLMPQKSDAHASIPPSASPPQPYDPNDIVHRFSTGLPSATITDYNGMPPPAKLPISSTALTRQNLNEVLATYRPDSMNDKMARYEGATHIDTIEMLTGLRYHGGERSAGISTGAASPNLIRGDEGIAMVADKDGRPVLVETYSTDSYGDGNGDKKKRIKIADEYVCTDCGALDSPEWRKGPTGPKTLCNACGLRWAKKEKRRIGYLPGSGDAGSVGISGQGDSPIGNDGGGSGGASMTSQSGQLSGHGASMPGAQQVLGQA